jgi:Carbohydrate esterase, sialic acid-specific acetylesterase
MVANPPGTRFILTFGQSNAANSGEEHYAAREAVHVFNMFDMRFYRAIDPLPGASENRGSVWGRLGDKLIDAGFARSVLFVPIAFGATYIEDWAPGGQCYPRLMLALHRLKKIGIAVDLLCWHQGEANANHTPMTADEYRDCFRAMLRGVREAGVKVPVYVALATLCEDDSHPFQNSVQIRLGQKELVSLWDRVRPGPDTDQIGTAHRWDGCHFSASGQELAAQAWFLAITAGPLHRLLLWSKYRLEYLFARSKMMTGLSLFTGANMMTVLNRAILWPLEQRGYVLLKKTEYELAANADGLGNILWRKYVLAQADGAHGGGRMTTVLKRLILLSLDRRGYVLLRKAEYDRMAAAAPSNIAAADHAPGPEPSSAPAATPPTPGQIAPPLAPAAIPMTAETPPTPVATPTAPSDRPPLPQLPPSPVPEFAADSDLHVEFERACGRLKDKLTLPPNQALAIYCAVRHLVRARIPGDLVDCGEGVPEVLALVAASFAALGETSRRLVLFDITSDFRHRPETDVPLWGTDYDLVSVQRPPPRPKKRVLPDVFAASGYPAERIVVVRYPVDTIDLTRPIAFLGLSAETYEANRAAVRTLAPRVSIGGVIAVEGNEHTPRAAIPGCVQHHLDAVAEFLKARGSDLPFWQVTDQYRLAVKSRPFAE